MVDFNYNSLTHAELTPTFEFSINMNVFCDSPVRFEFLIHQLIIALCKFSL